MKIFIDSADIDEIIKADSTGLIDGVTTNPTLIKRSGSDPYDVYDRVLNETNITDLSMEVSGSQSEMLHEADRLIDRYGESFATIKVPMTKDGLSVCRSLSAVQVRINVTLIFSIPQAILAAKAGAHYVSPFVGRLDDQSVAGLEVVRGIASLYQQQAVPTQVLAASIRTVHKAVRSFYNGASVVTMPPKVFYQMYDHILTDQGLAIFERDLIS
jgi:transaldolase